MCIYFCMQNRLQMSKNVNNDISMNPPIKVAQTRFQNFPRFWWVITTTHYQLMLQSW